MICFTKGLIEFQLISFSKIYFIHNFSEIRIVQMADLSLIDNMPITMLVRVFQPLAVSAVIAVLCRAEQAFKRKSLELP